MARLAVVGGVLLVYSASATSDLNPYAAIIERNVFALREPSPAAPPPAPAPVAADTSELVLTGVVDFRTIKWALLTCTERGKTARQYTLGVGQRQDNIEVLDIDAESATVRVRHGNTERVLSFQKPGKPEDAGQKYVQQAKAFVDEHARAHALREQREAERRALERVAAEAELATRQISTHMDEPNL